MNISSTCKEDGHSHPPVATHSLAPTSALLRDSRARTKPTRSRARADEPTRRWPWDTALGEAEGDARGRMATFAAISVELTHCTVRGKARKEKRTYTNLWQTQTRP